MLACLAWRLVPAFETLAAMLLDVELRMAVALAMPCFVATVEGLGAGPGESLAGEREGWRTLPAAFRDKEDFSDDSPDCYRTIVHIKLPQHP